jgi:hypothetical protein
MLQEQTTRIVEALRELAPERQFNTDFLAIISAGTGKVFEPASH